MTQQPRDSINEVVERVARVYFAKCAEFSSPGAATTLETLNPTRRAEVLSCFAAVVEALSPAQGEVERLRTAAAQSNDAICQTLGKALGYPWFKDDQQNFPGATEANGVCVGDHVAESLAEEAAQRISTLSRPKPEAEQRK